MSRLRTLNTGADESTAADTWRDALEMKAALAWSAAGTLTAATGMMTDPAALIPAAGAFWMAAVRGHQAYSVLRARASLAGRGMLLENRKAFAGRMRPVLEQGRIWFGRGFLWQPEHSQKLYELSKIDAARLIPPLWITRRLLGRSIKDPDTIGQGFIHGVNPRNPTSPWPKRRSKAERSSWGRRRPEKACCSRHSLPSRSCGATR